jgi:uncharacterized protein YndB with AHSA1/START domain
MNDNEDTSGREIVTTRMVNAPRTTVFRAWTDPVILAKWWGPKGFTNTFHTYDLRPTGLWDFTMHGPDGASYHNTSVFKRIDAPALLAFNHMGHRSHVTVRFTEEGTGTHIEWRMLFPTIEECDKVRGIIPAANEENLDRLEAELMNIR